MKKSLFLLAAMVLSTTLVAQLKVDSTGKVIAPKHLIVGTTLDSQTQSGLYVHQNIAGAKYYGVYSYIETPILRRGEFFNVAICGETNFFHTQQLSQTIPDYSLPQGFFAGVVGRSSAGVGVYGTTGAKLPTVSIGNYAGYFAGDVKVAGTLSAAVVSTTSDQRLKENIQSISDTYLADGLLGLRPVSFTYKADTTAFSYHAESQEMRNTHYGLLAQEVQAVLPDIVYQNQDGYLSINYTELIPLLIQTVKDLNEKVEALEETVANASTQGKRKTQGNHSAADVATPVLYQNNPNPFTENTVIGYALPLSTQSATLYIYNMSGTQIDSYPIAQFGQGTITIDGNRLPAGMYLYSLIADGQVVDTKQMILTK